MAKIKIKFGANEVEVDSRDFYLDNQTIGDVIESLSRHMNKNAAEAASENPAEPPPEAAEVTAATTTTTTAAPETTTGPKADYGSLNSLEDAEAFEPEFSEPRPIGPGEIRSKLRILETSRFFDSPRTVAETVQQLREFGWAAGLLDVSKALARMASAKEISKNSVEERTHYFARTALLAN